MRSSRIIWVSPKSNEKGPCKRQKRRGHREEKPMYRWRLRLELCSYRLRNAWSYQKLEEARKDSPLEPSKGVALPKS